jgi:hypothetical protein
MVGVTVDNANASMAKMIPAIIFFIGSLDIFTSDIFTLSNVD